MYVRSPQCWATYTCMRVNTNGRHPGNVAIMKWYIARESDSDIGARVSQEIRLCKCMQERFTAVFLSFSLGSHPYFCTKWWKSSVLPYLAAHWRQLRRPSCMHKQVIWWSTRATHSAENALNHPILHNSGYNMTQACTTCTHNVPSTIPKVTCVPTYVKTFTIQSCRLPSGMQIAQRAYAYVLPQNAWELDQTFDHLIAGVRSCDYVYVICPLETSK